MPRGRPRAPRRPRRDARRVWDGLVLQGGGALGAYECGAYEALAEREFDFDIVAGVSIGAANAAIVVSRGKEAPTYLRRFWDALEDTTAEIPAGNEGLRRQLSAWKSVYWGNPRMFTPRWVMDPWNLQSLSTWTSLYDPAPYGRLLDRVIDFAALRSTHRRLLVTAVDIQSGELKVFDSAQTPLTRAHILASGALPPAFPSVTIDGRSYWDGGLVSNTPARAVLHALPPEDRRRLVLIELFPHHHRVPRNLAEVLDAMKDLTYMDKLGREIEHSRNDRTLHKVIDECLAALTPRERSRLMALPEYVSLLQTHRHHMELFLLTHRLERGENESKDYDFSPTSLRRHRHEGRHAADEAIHRWESRDDWAPFGSFRSREGAGPARAPTPA
jgi:predicted acylesterase/phospholipase RssA